MHDAARWGHYSIIELLIGRGADPNSGGSDGRKPLHEAAGNGSSKCIQMLLDHGANVNAPLGKYDRAHSYVLNDSLTGLNPEFEWMDPEFDDELAHTEIETALQLAVRGKHFDCARLLIDRGAMSILRLSPARPCSWTSAPTATTAF